MATADICRRHGLSPATFYKLKAKYGGMDVSNAQRLKALEDENGKLKRLAGGGHDGEMHPGFAALLIENRGRVEPLGAALFVIVLWASGMPIEGLSQVLKNVVQGIGVMGAGAIMLQAKQRAFKGLTTATSICSATAQGSIASLRLETAAMQSAVVVLIILGVIPLIMPKSLEADLPPARPIRQPLRRCSANRLRVA